MTEPAEPFFTCDLGRHAEKFPHFWEHTVGSGHAALALRADWQAQMARCRRELGFQHVRFHGLLNDEMGTLVGEKGKPVYSFFNADRIVDFLLAMGMRPFVELSFMPTMLASGSQTVFHYRANVTPPTGDAEWGALIRKLARHWIDLYGAAEVEAWLFEVWNEPNLTAFWTGTQRDYFWFYRATARALKGVNPALAVGGPATAKNAWIEEFLDFCAKHEVPTDFVSTHHYPTDAFGMPGDDTETQLANSRRSILREQARTARRQAGRLPLYYTEWNSSSNPCDALHDRPYAAAFLVKTVMEAAGLVEGYSWWTFTDLFEENYFPSIPFHGGFGLLTIHGIPKPTYRAFQVLHGLGNERLTVDGSHPTVDAWVVRKAGSVTVLLTNWALPRHPIATERVLVHLTGASGPASAVLTRLDKDHANPRKRWEEMGTPDTLTPRDIENLQAASSLREEPLPVEFASGAISFAIAAPPQSVVAVTLELP